MLYKVAENIFEINVEGDMPCWALLSSHYAPFFISQGEPIISIDLKQGSVDTSQSESMPLIHRDEIVEDGSIRMEIYADERSYLFFLTQPRQSCPNISVRIDRDYKHTTVTLADASPTWQNVCSLTSAIQLAYMMATCSLNTLLTHSSAVIADGKAYLFLGKSGTGKSTHSRLWLKNVEGTTLLNDDHPILRIGDDASVIAYGSPWSGKTDCYKNLQAPVGAIVRISRAKTNFIQPLNTLQAYASLIASFSGMTIDRSQADLRHRTIEKVIASVPCYTMNCLPDDEAAVVCSSALINK